MVRFESDEPQSPTASLSGIQPRQPEPDLEPGFRLGPMPGSGGRDGSGGGSGAAGRGARTVGTYAGDGGSKNMSTGRRLSSAANVWPPPASPVRRDSVMNTISHISSLMVTGQTNPRLSASSQAGGGGGGGGGGDGGDGGSGGRFAPGLSQSISAMRVSAIQTPKMFLQPSLAVVDICPEGDRTAHPRMVARKGEDRLRLDTSEAVFAGSSMEIREEDSIFFLPGNPPIENLKVGGIRVVMREVRMTTAWKMANVAAGNLAKQPQPRADSTDGSPHDASNAAANAVHRQAGQSSADHPPPRKLAARLPRFPGSNYAGPDNDFMWQALATVEDQIKKTILNLYSEPFGMRKLQALLKRDHTCGTRSGTNGIDRPSRGRDCTSAGFFLQAPIYKDVLSRAVGLPQEARLGLHPLLSTPWRFSEALSWPSVAFSDATTWVQFQHRPDGRSIVNVCVPALSCDARAVEPFPAGYALEPVLQAFETLLLSSESATRFLKLIAGAENGRSNSNLETALTARKAGCQLVLLDLLRVTMDAWANFAATTNVGSGEKTQLAVGTDGLLGQLREDVHRSEQLAAMVRDMGGCLHFLLGTLSRMVERARRSSSGGRGGSHSGGRQNSDCNSSSNGDADDWTELVRELTALDTEVQNQALDLARRTARNMTAYTASLSEKQGQNATRLTLVAATFLPLSLSSSLLNMTTRAWDIGKLWVDWVGLSMVLAVLLIFLHQLVKLTGDALTTVGSHQSVLVARLTSSVKKIEGVVLYCVAVALGIGLFCSLVSQPDFRVTAWLSSIIVGLTLLILSSLHAHRLRGFLHLARQALQLASFFAILSWTGLTLGHRDGDGYDDAGRVAGHGGAGGSAGSHSEGLLSRHGTGQLTSFLVSYNGVRAVEALAYFRPLRQWIIDRRFLLVTLLHHDGHLQEALSILRLMSTMDDNIRDMLQDIIQDLEFLLPPPAENSAQSANASGATNAASDAAVASPAAFVPNAHAAPAHNNILTAGNIVFRDSLAHNQTSTNPGTSTRGRLGSPVSSLSEPPSPRAGGSASRFAEPGNT